MAKPGPYRSRPYDTTQPDTLNNVISALFAQRGYGRVQASRQLAEIWRDLVDEQTARQTKVLNLNNGVLQIGVSNSALLSELSSFRKYELEDEIQNKHPDLRIRELKFRLRGDLA